MKYKAHTAYSSKVRKLLQMLSLPLLQTCSYGARGKAQETQVVSLVKNMEELLRFWCQKFFPWEKRPAMLLISISYCGQEKFSAKIVYSTYAVPYLIISHEGIV